MSHVVRWTDEQLKNYRARQMLDAVAIAPIPPYDPAAIKASPAKASPGKAKTGKQAKESPLEAMLEQQMIASKLPWFERQHKHIPGRRLSLDFAWPDLKIGVEVQGMCHRIKEKFEKDIEKRALAQLSGWRVLEVSGSTIRSGQAVQWIAQMLSNVKE